MANTPKPIRKVAGQVVKDYKKVSDKKLPPLAVDQNKRLSVSTNNEKQAKVLATDTKGYAVKQVIKASRKAANKNVSMATPAARAKAGKPMPSLVAKKKKKP
jgi:hypothetical protein